LFSEPLPSDGCCIVAYFAATGICATILKGFIRPMLERMVVLAAVAVAAAMMMMRLIDMHSFILSCLFFQSVEDYEFYDELNL
jgi:hypothetical protein